MQLQTVPPYISKCFLTAVFTFVLLGDVVAQPLDDLIFYEGNGCTQDVVFTYNSRIASDDNCKQRGTRCRGDNDEARSLRIGKTASANTRITVFDSPSGSQDDDYTVIEVVNPNFMEDQGYCLRSFEQNFDTPNANQGIFVDYFRHNGLDGKVSRVRVEPR